MLPSKVISVCLIVLFSSILFGCSGPDKNQQSLLPIEKLAGYENLTMIQIDSPLTVAAYSERLNNNDARSEVLVFRKHDNQYEQIFRRTLTLAYNARLEQRYDLSYSDKPLVILRVQHGAASETQEVFGVEHGSLKFLQSLDAGAFEWSYDVAKKHTLLVAIPSDTGEQPASFEWNGSQFKPVIP